MKFKFIYLDKTHSVKLEKKDNSYKVVIDDNNVYEVFDFVTQGNIISFKLNNELVNIYFAQDRDKRYLAVDGNYFMLESEKATTLGTKGPVLQKGNSVASPMPGLLVKIPVAIGDKIETGTTLAIVEAMKMQNELRAPCDGVIKKINFKEGDQVDALQVIVELETK